jgi:regulator of protease activity HflC (stomatin/prohibitin superfamily)
MADDSGVWVLVGSVVLVLLAGLVVHVVPEYQRIVVTRLGRVVRVDGPGATFRVPGLERTTTVSLRPRELQIVVSTTLETGSASNSWSMWSVASPSRPGP